MKSIVRSRSTTRLTDAFTPAASDAFIPVLLDRCGAFDRRLACRPEKDLRAEHYNRPLPADSGTGIRVLI
jgi:hypothetical protein